MRRATSSGRTAASVTGSQVTEKKAAGAARGPGWRQCRAQRAPEGGPAKGSVAWRSGGPVQRPARRGAITTPADGLGLLGGDDLTVLGSRPSAPTPVCRSSFSRRLRPPRGDHDTDGLWRRGSRPVRAIGRPGRSRDAPKPAHLARTRAATMPLEKAGRRQNPAVSDRRQHPSPAAFLTTRSAREDIRRSPRNPSLGRLRLRSTIR